MSGGESPLCLRLSFADSDDGRFVLLHAIFVLLSSIWRRGLCLKVPLRRFGFEFELLWIGFCDRSCTYFFDVYFDNFFIGTLYIVLAPFAGFEPFDENKV